MKKIDSGIGGSNDGCTDHRRVSPTRLPMLRRGATRKTSIALMIVAIAKTVAVTPSISASDTRVWRGDDGRYYCKPRRWDHRPDHWRSRWRPCR